MFTAENAYHLASLNWAELTVIKEIRHSERIREPFDFQSVVIVRSSHQGGVNSLRGIDFCHPGLHYERHQKWSERFLKHFERSIVRTNCSFDGSSPAELEVAGLSEFFNAACRPGSWSNNPYEDAMLKAKFPNLCSLCDNAESCTYENPALTSHRQALECVRKSGNAITYVALQEAQTFFSEQPAATSEFSFMCPNGTLQAITDNARPCVWLTQPWKVILSTNEKAISLAQNVGRWVTSFMGWEDSLRQILVPDSASIVAVNAIVTLPDYMRPIRPVPIAVESACPAGIRWCTNSYDEKQKCEVLRMAALTSGIVPNIFCNDPKSDAVTCIAEVAKGAADFVGIDSNFGYLARK